MNRIIKYLILSILIISCNQSKEQTIINHDSDVTESNVLVEPEDGINYKKLFENNVQYISQGFDYPVGKPDANGYYNAQKFGENDHLGDDWNGLSGGNTDLGDPIYSIGNGYIAEAKDDGGGWGNVVRVIHLYDGKLYESVYAHCDTILVKTNSFIKKGDQLGTIGNCNGAYYAHLHLEIRDSVNLDIGGGYSKDTEGYLDPTLFIKNNRQ